MSSFLSYSIFWLIPGWGRETHHVYLFAWASKTHMRASPRQGPLRYSGRHLRPYTDGESPLSEALLSFYVNQGIQPLSLLSSLNCKLFSLSKSIYLFRHGVLSLNYPGSTGAGRRQHINQQLSQIEKKNTTLSLYSANLLYINTF